MKSQDFSAEVEAAIKVAGEAAKIIKAIDKGDKINGTTEYDDGYRHVVTVTKADLDSQRYILTILGTRFPLSHFLAEEKPGRAGEDENFSRMILGADTLELLNKGVIFGVDPIDGTTQFDKRLWEWSVSVGVMTDGCHRGGAIVAPAVRGGISVWGERDKGVFIFEHGRTKQVKITPKRRVDREGIVFIGVDFFRLPDFKEFLFSFPQKVRTTKVTGSCALGLAAVTVGRVDALIQPVQKPWDWFAGYPLVVEAGGKFQFYHYREGKIEPLSKPDLAGYNPDRPNLAFIAGNPELVDWLFELLLDSYGK